MAAISEGVAMKARAQVPNHRQDDVSERSRTVGAPRVVALRLIGGGVALWGLLSVIGLLVTRVSSSDPGRSWDAGAALWFAARRTGFWNTATAIGSGLANTTTAIAVMIIAVLLLRWRLGRWYESWVVVAAISGELLVFLAVTATVHRARPAVTRLDQAPPTSSFPSGHTAAAVALYGCLAILLLWAYGRHPVARIAAFMLVCIPVLVGISRVYRGMHYPSDVLMGAVGGGLWLLVVITTLLPRRDWKRS
jgi:undecaprenyl-diphosphatase